jgi:hypothetical protein
MALDARIAQGRILIPPEGKHRLVHLLGLGQTPPRFYDKMYCKEVMTSYI